MKFFFIVFCDFTPILGHFTDQAMTLEAMDNQTQVPAVLQLGTVTTIEYRLRRIAEVDTHALETGNGHDIKRHLALVQTMGRGFKVGLFDTEAVFQVGIIVPVQHTGHRQVDVLGDALVEHQRKLQRTHHKIGVTPLELP